jgi:short-subunit dehydrogenase
MSRAIVTGASGGLGLEFAKLLAKDGADLVLVARSGDKLERLASELRAAHGTKVETIAQDLGVFDAVARITGRVRECDVLINNAGFANRGKFDEIAPEATREELLLDVVTLTELTRAYLPGMRAARSGRILNVASTAGFLPGPYGAVYYAAKAYVISFSQAIAEELRGSGVTVTCLCPGATDTGFADRANMRNTLLFRMPRADAPSVALAGYRAMLAGHDLCVPGLRNQLTGVFAKFAPRRMLLRVSARLIAPR